MATTEKLAKNLTINPQYLFVNYVKQSKLSIFQTFIIDFSNCSMFKISPPISCLCHLTTTFMIFFFILSEGNPICEIIFTNLDSLNFNNSARLTFHAQTQSEAFYPLDIEIWFLKYLDSQTNWFFILNSKSETFYPIDFEKLIPNGVGLTYIPMGLDSLTYLHEFGTYQITCYNTYFGHVQIHDIGYIW